MIKYLLTNRGLLYFSNFFILYSFGDTHVGNFVHGVGDVGLDKKTQQLTGKAADGKQQGIARQPFVSILFQDGKSSFFLILGKPKTV